jgi:thioredoxin reductase (NADPH)
VEASGVEQREPAPDAVLLLVDDSPDDLRRTARALERRFGLDYRVIAAATAPAGVAELERLAQAGAPVALVAVGLAAPADAVDLLRRARALHPDAARAALVAMGEPAGPAKDPVFRAIALGEIDFPIANAWVSPEEWLYPQVQEAVSAWAMAHRPRHEHFRIVGEQWAPRSHRLRDVLTRSRVPFAFHAADSSEGRRVLAEHGLDAARLPVAVLFDGRVLVEPDDQALAAALGVRTSPSPGLHDLAIVGAGPAGLAAAVYAASEGLRTLVIEPEAPGGQAGTTSRIRNYLGFPRGVSGSELTARGFEQARVFGAEFVFTRRATGIELRGEERVVRLSGGFEAAARSVVIATGVSYRRLGVEPLERLVGSGVFYGAATTEARAMAEEDVLVVGGGNSAGQAALHLARFARRVTLLVRGDSLGAGMSDYLVRELGTARNVEVRARARVVGGRGAHRLEGVLVEDARTGWREELAATAMFVLVGAEPRTAWLPDAMQRDGSGYVLTGNDVSPEPWPLGRSPMLLESSVPGVFAVGDVRHGSVKRVAAAAGEGSVAVGSVHQYLAGLAAGGDGG